jgi:hypothetical protein
MKADIGDILGQYYRLERTKKESIDAIGNLFIKEELAEFIQNACDRGWITRGNLGLNEDGYRI